MVSVNAVNLVVCAWVYRRSLEPGDGCDAVYRKWMRIMGLVFTLVGAYRAVFVSRYITQMAWFDSVANSALLIRVFAIAAELSFSGLFALGMLRVNLIATNNKKLFQNLLLTFYEIVTERTDRKRLVSTAFWRIDSRVASCTPDL